MQNLSSSGHSKLITSAVVNCSFMLLLLLISCARVMRGAFLPPSLLLTMRTCPTAQQPCAELGLARSKWARGGNSYLDGMSLETWRPKQVPL